MLRLVIDGESSNRHDSNVLLNVVLCDEVTHVVFVSDGVLLISLLLLLDHGKLVLGKGDHVMKNLYSTLVCRWRGTTSIDLIRNLGSDTFEPAANLIIDQLHILAPLHQRVKLGLELLFLDRQVGILRLSLLHIVLKQHEGMNLRLVR